MTSVFDVSAGLLPGLANRWAELWSILGLVHRLLVGHSRAASVPGEPGWQSALVGFPGRLCLEVGQPYVSFSEFPVQPHWGMLVEGFHDSQVGTPSLRLSSPSSGTMSPCLSFPQEALEKSLARSRLRIFSWLSLLFPVWTRESNITSAASTVSSLLIGLTMPCLPTQCGGCCKDSVRSSIYNAWLGPGMWLVHVPCKNLLF